MDKKVNKQAIINEYLLGCFTYRELEKKHGVSRQTINEWVLDYQGIPRSKTIRRQKATLQLMKGKKQQEGGTLPPLPAEVLELQKQLEQERLHNKLLTAMIDIAEEELNIPIRKKYGTRQFKK
jgi:transposase-like protein